MAFKKPNVQTAVPESPDRLFRDLPRRKHPSLYDHQGQILRNYVAQALSASDVALQLPTGSGKTLVGLLLAEWRRRKNHERIVYLCPTRQLVSQVATEATTKYGMTVEPFVGASRDYAPEAKAAYVNAERVAVTTYSSLFNTNPFFRDPEVIIVDDAHSSENYIANQWTLRIQRLESEDEGLFKAVASVLKGVLDDFSFDRLTGNWHTEDDFIWVDKVPTPKLASIAGELRAAISANVGVTEHRYAWRMIGGHLMACQLYLSTSEILIRPLIPPTWSHAPFAGAAQRIFMSATLGAGGDLERLTGRTNIVRLPIPDGWDRQGIGRRFFIFPEKSLSESEVIELRRSMMKLSGRSLVLTPSNESAGLVIDDIKSSLKFAVYSGADLEDKKADFVVAPQAVAVVANRYDGIDFPDDDCRLQFVEGLPRAVNLQERFLMTRMGANMLFNERVQTRVLQAVGRCTRALNDYSAVVITGEDLPAYLTDRKRRGFFHPELQAELEFGIEQSSEIKASEILDNFNIFLEHGERWEDANQSILDAREKAIQSEFPAMSELANSVTHEIAWQRAMWDGDFAKAYDSAREVLGKLHDPGLRGYRALWHYLAGSAAEMAAADGEKNLEAPARAQFRQSKEAASGVTWLVALSRNDDAPLAPEEANRLTVMFQVEALENYLYKLGTVHNRRFSAREKAIRDGLNGAADFESAQVLLGRHLGFEAEKREEDASPDPWWRIGDMIIVFEDHANAGGNATIDATKARQAASHPAWLRDNISGAAECEIIPVLITPAKRATAGAMPSLSHVMHWDLNEFRTWADAALTAVRELRRTFTEPGHLVWRAEAAQKLQEIRADGPGLSKWLSRRPAKDLLSDEP